MIYLLPMAPWQKTIPECWDSIMAQTLKGKIVINFSGGERTNEQLVKLPFIAKCRNELVECVGSEKYSVMIDRDVVLVENNIIETMCEYLEGNPDFGAVGLRELPGGDEKPEHVPLSCVMVRKEVWDTGIRFKDKMPCECLSFIQDVRQAGFKMGYLRNQADIKHLHVFL